MKSQILTTESSESASQLPEPVVLTPDQLKAVAGAVSGSFTFSVPPIGTIGGTIWGLIWDTDKFPPVGAVLPMPTVGPVP
jgi:hypothetical protein